MTSHPEPQDWQVNLSSHAINIENNREEVQAEGKYNFIYIRLVMLLKPHWHCDLVRCSGGWFLSGCSYVARSITVGPISERIIERGIVHSSSPAKFVDGG